METTTMFSRFAPPMIGGPPDRRTVQDRRRRPARFRQPDRARARFQLERLEDRRLLSGISGVTEFPVPSTSPATHGIAVGSDGNLWFTETSSNAIGMINPTTHSVSSFPIPTANSNAFGIAAGPDGNLWFCERYGNKIGMINPTTHAITEFTVPIANAHPREITAGPDGNLWFIQDAVSDFGMINPTTHAISEFAAVTGARFGITAGPDGNVWFTTSSGVGMINPTTHAVDLFATGQGGAKGIAAGPDGNLWFTNSYASMVGMINPTNDAITEVATPTTNSSLWGITAGPDGNLWFAEDTAGNLGEINPTTDAITEYPVPGTVASIITGRDGNLWFTAGGAIGVATLTTSQLVVTTQPPASVTAGSPFGLTVTAEDSSGNPITSFNGTVTVALGNNPGGATLGGTLTATASNGMATFSGLTLNKAASGYTFAVSASGLGEGVTNVITVTPAAATQLMITQQPPGTVKVNSGFGFQASIEDQYGNVVTTAANTVTVAFANNPTGTTLGGTLSVTASQGVATFPGLTINKTGSGYTLQVTSSGLSSAVTNPINVTKTGTSSALAATTTTSTPNSLLAPLVLDSPDLWDSLGLKKRSRLI
jgi:streptogramin lyase